MDEDFEFIEEVGGEGAAEEFLVDGTGQGLGGGVWVSAEAGEGSQGEDEAGDGEEQQGGSDRHGGQCRRSRGLGAGAAPEGWGCFGAALSRAGSKGGRSRPAPQPSPARGDGVGRLARQSALCWAAVVLGERGFLGPPPVPSPASGGGVEPRRPGRWGGVRWAGRGVVGPLTPTLARGGERGRTGRKGGRGARGLLGAELPGVEVVLLFLGEGVDGDAHGGEFEAGDFVVDVAGDVVDVGFE